MQGQVNLTGYSSTDVVDATVNWGDGTSSTKRENIYTSSTPQSVSLFLYHTYTIPGVYTPQLVVEATGGLKDTILASPITVNSCGNLTGNAYLDNNNDCVFNTGDVAFKNTMVTATDPVKLKTYYGSTNALGEYDILVPAGATYDVNINAPYLTVDCPVGGHTGISVPSTGIDLGLQCGPGFDLFGSAQGFAYRSGFKRVFYANATNASCNPTNATLKVVLSDSRIHYSPSASALTPPIIKGDTLIWNFTGLDYSSLNNNWTNYRGFYLMTDTSAKIGDTICIDVIVEPSSGDSDPSNNATTYCFPVVNSFDPNEKAAQPLGVGPENIIAPGTTLDYTVFFQNTGNDTAYNVFILDEIDENLDLSTLSILGSSHPMDWVVYDNNSIRFNFPNINLLDSNSNEPLSHGYVSYRITPKASTPLGTIIENTAGIYFDFNDPIITNTTSHKVANLTGINESIYMEQLVNIYPNPTTGAVTVDLLNSTNGLLTVKTLVGQSLQSFRLVEGKNSIDVSGLSSGVYLMEINNGSQTQVKRVIVH